MTSHAITKIFIIHFSLHPDQSGLASCLSKRKQPRQTVSLQDGDNRHCFGLVYFQQEYLA